MAEYQRRRRRVRRAPDDGPADRPTRDDRTSADERAADPARTRKGRPVDPKRGEPRRRSAGPVPEPPRQRPVPTPPAHPRRRDEPAAERRGPHPGTERRGGHPGDEGDGERGLRGLVGAGSSQVGVAAAMRARDASRPTAEDLAAAEHDLTIVRRHWVPRDPA